jgi:hypothetical protein
MEENRRPRFRFRLRALLLVVAVLALLLVVVIQQVQISRQQAQIRQMRQQIDRYARDSDQLTTIVRELQDHLDRQRQRGQSAEPPSSERHGESAHKDFLNGFSPT